MIEITKACTVAFIKARNFISCSMKRETCQLEKNPGDWEIFFFNALANRFWLTSESYSWFNKVVHAWPFAKWTSWKGNDILLKVD